MTPAVPFEHVIFLDCGKEDSEKCRIFLPHRSPEETLESAEYLPMFSWPITAVCLLHGRVSVRYSGSIRDAAPGSGPDQPTLLWCVELVCGRADCARERTLYVGAQPDAESVRRKLSMLRPEMGCREHSFEWSEDQMTVTLVEV